MDTQKKLSFPELKKFLIFKHPSDSAQKGVRCVKNDLGLETFSLKKKNEQSQKSTIVLHLCQIV